MRKVFCLLMIMLLTSGIASAKSFKLLVEALDPIDLNNPPEVVKTKLVKDKIFDDKVLVAGSIFEGEIAKVVQEKRGKRDEYFYYRINSIKFPYETEPRKINNQKVKIKAKRYKSIDKKDIALSAGTTVAGFFVDYISLPLNFARGVIEQPYEDTSRLKSGAKMMYEKSPLSFISKGKEMRLDAGDFLTLTVKYNKD